jgi:hypothetical protein
VFGACIDLMMQKLLVGHVLGDLKFQLLPCVGLPHTY